MSVHGIPKRFWKASMDAVPDSVHRRVAERYIAGLTKFVTSGNGLLLWGPNRRGKTSLAVIVQMEAIRRGYDTHFVRAADLVDAIIQTRMVDDETSIQEVARKAQLLVLDDLAKEGESRSGRIEGIIDNELRARESECRATIITTNATLDELRRTLKRSTIAMMESSFYPVHVDGPDFQVVERNALATALEPSE